MELRKARIEIEKKFEIIPNESLLSKVIADIYTSIGISSLDEFRTYLSESSIDLKKVKKNTIPINDSIKGYWIEILFLQNLHLPFKISQLKIGILSNQLIVELHFIHLLLG